MCPNPRNFHYFGLSWGVPAGRLAPGLANPILGAGPILGGSGCFPGRAWAWARAWASVSEPGMGPGFHLFVPGLGLGVVRFGCTSLRGHGVGFLWGSLGCGEGFCGQLHSVYVCVFVHSFTLFSNKHL